jgi:hypothetical protein
MSDLPLTTAIAVLERGVRDYLRRADASAAKARSYPEPYCRYHLARARAHRASARQCREAVRRLGGEG